MKNIEQLCIDTIRVLGVDTINKAKSGHPGIVLGAAPMMHALFTKHLNIDPENPDWFERDRFVLSAGHGSALLYTMLHLSGFNVTIDDLQKFRQLGSKTPGHPEYGHTDGVEMTTGPLGQGIATAVGMAIAESFLAAKFNKYERPIINHNTYVLCGDGDLQEGIAMEAVSLAGHLKLNKLIVLYDSNDIQLDGEVTLSNTESTKEKFEAMGWNYIRVEDGTKYNDISKSIFEAKEQEDKPTIIEIKTVIGYGSPLSGESASHGAPLGNENTESLRQFLDYSYRPFEVDEEVHDFYRDNVAKRGSRVNNQWNSNLQRYSKDFPEEYQELLKFIDNDFSIDLDKLPTWEVGSVESTRKVLGKVLDNIASQLPNILGGSADLTASTFVKGADGNFDVDNQQGRNIKFGVREHAMAAITNGITLHGGLRGYCAGFFVFSDYMKPAMRLASIMKINPIYIFSHDTVNVGEDGPTHQPIEQLTMLRSIPGFNVFRPADATETIASLLIAFETKHNPIAITTTRQGVENLDCTDFEGVAKGGYVAFEPNHFPTGIIVTCGSELALAIEVAKKFEAEGEYVRVVSMPSMYLFDKQSDKYKESVLPKRITKRLAVEMGSSMPWYKYSQNVYGIDEFGISSPINHIAKHYGFTTENIYNIYKNIE